MLYSNQAFFEDFVGKLLVKLHEILNTLFEATNLL